MVIGFHHCGTSLLRHMLGSHPAAHEHIPEIIPSPAELRALRLTAAAQGKTWLIIKHPLNSLAHVARAAALQGAPALRFVWIRRPLVRGCWPPTCGVLGLLAER